jgi:hypothetical protein
MGAGFIVDFARASHRIRGRRRHTTVSRIG